MGNNTVLRTWQARTTTIAWGWRGVVPLATAMICLLTAPGLGQNVDAGLTVAVMEFEDTSPTDEFARLGRALQSMLTTDLLASRDLRLVERARLQDVLAELDLAKTGFLDAATAAKVGKGVGAKAVLTGTFWVREKQMRIDARLVHVETGTVILAEEISGAARDFTKLEKQLATQILDAAGVRLSKMEMADLSKQHTSSLLAASRYGQALDAEDSGRFDLARRSAAEALEADPDFELAAALLKQIERLLERAKEAEFQRNVVFITFFEDHLNGWAFEHPRFRPEGYPKLLEREGPERALFYWVSYLGNGRAPLGRIKPYDLLFAHPSPLDRSHGGVVRAYHWLGGAEPIIFWCDVATSDPRYVPSTPLTERMLHPNPLSLPVSGPYPAYFYWRLPSVYFSRFGAQAEILGDLEEAVTTLERMYRICQPIVPSAVYTQNLERLKGILDSPSRLTQEYRRAQERRHLWRMARDHIVTYHAVFQHSRFGKVKEAVQQPSAEQVRAEWIRELAPRLVVLQGGVAAQERQAKQIVDRFLKEAGGARFVVRRRAVAGGGDQAEILMVMHLAGCPAPYLLEDAHVDEKGGNIRTTDDPDEGLREGWVPCAHCRPFRWATPVAIEEHLANRVPELIDRFVKDGAPAVKHEMVCLLTAFQDHPVPEARESLKRLCKKVCSEPLGDRELHAIALQCAARTATSDDVEWLAGILETTPWWDVRINVAATLASIDDDRVCDMLRKAEEREPYYFVVHSLKAAQARARERTIRARLRGVESKVEAKDIPAARKALTLVLREITEDPTLPAPIRENWGSDLRARIKQLGDEPD